MNAKMDDFHDWIMSKLIGFLAIMTINDINDSMPKGDSWEK